MQVIKLFIIFYVKKVSTITASFSSWGHIAPMRALSSVIRFLFQISLSMNCQPPKHTGRAAQMQTVFIALLFFPSFVGALSMVAYTVWRWDTLSILAPIYLKHKLQRSFNAFRVQHYNAIECSSLFLSCSLEPSKHCGPFQGLNTPFDTIISWTDYVHNLPGTHWVWWIFENVLRSELFYYLITLIILYGHFLFQARIFKEV